MLNHTGIWSQEQYIIIVLTIEYFHAKFHNTSKSGLALKYIKEDKMTEVPVNNLIEQFSREYKFLDGVGPEHTLFAKVIINAFKTKDLTELKRLMRLG